MKIIDTGKYELKDNELNLINGDAAKDNDWNKSVYQPGQWVEIYNTCLHRTTRRVKIMNRIRNSWDDKFQGWTCTTYDGDDKIPRNVLIVSATDIQK